LYKLFKYFYIIPILIFKTIAFDLILL